MHFQYYLKYHMAKTQSISNIDYRRDVSFFIRVSKKITKKAKTKKKM